MARLFALKPQNLERLPWKQQLITTRVLPQFCEQRQHLARQRDDVVSARFLGNQRPLHSAGRNPPQGVIGVKLCPSCPAQFVGAWEGMHHDLDGDARLGAAMIVPHAGDQLAQAGPINVREVLHWCSRIEEAL
ncbi:hypothetical protein G6F57_021340 [Rhizopus arrhizus]|nr:hypothetical protein G6F57_021340 [Rhizopus arrhizus]